MCLVENPVDSFEDYVHMETEEHLVEMNLALLAAAETAAAEGVETPDEEDYTEHVDLLPLNYDDTDAESPIRNAIAGVTRHKDILRRKQHRKRALDRASRLTTPCKQADIALINPTMVNEMFERHLKQLHVKYGSSGGSQQPVPRITRNEGNDVQRMLWCRDRWPLGKLDSLDDDHTTLQMMGDLSLLQ